MVKHFLPSVISLIFYLYQVNILIADNGKARLGDFGLSVFAEGESTNYAALRDGAAQWMAPELIDPHRFGLQDEGPTYAGTRVSDYFPCITVRVERLTFM